MSSDTKKVNNALGELRRSSVVMTFAPGAVVDFRAGGAPVSAVVAGLEEWDHSFPPAGLANPQRISEPRLQKKLGVDGFRLPPIVPERLGKDEEDDARALVAVRFPTWLQCPECDEIAPARKWGQEPGLAYRYCGRCSAARPGGRRIAVIPVRFVLACTAGHLDEFPWHYWVAHKSDCRADTTDGKLVLKSERPGLAGLILSCPKCGARRAMEGIFGKTTFSGFRCKARRPWLREETDPVGCGTAPGLRVPELRAVQRGASNLYFPNIQSALDIPPWSDQLQQTIGVYWSDIVNVASPEERRMFIGILARNALADALVRLRMTAAQLAGAIEQRLAGLDAVSGEDLRLEEYRKLGSGVDTASEDDQEFEIRNESVPTRLAGVLEKLVRVTRLREVRALTGFTRIHPPGGEGASAMAPISSTKTRWLPAIEVRGEGIFFTFNMSGLQGWEERTDVTERIGRLRTAAEGDWTERYPDVPFPLSLTPRFVLLHTVAHAVIRQLTLECGYSTASLRERLYVSEGDAGMCGVLVYTSTPDSDGTLGGLERQGLPQRFERAFVNAISSLEWCSSDPLCIEGVIGGLDTFSLAACHACCLAPETSCEHYNRYLDRALIVGAPDMLEVGFLRSLLPGEPDGQNVAAPTSA
jgi:hypothetical protein